MLTRRDWLCLSGQSLVGIATNPPGISRHVLTQFISTEDRFARYLSVKSTGAKGDGVADDTIAFTNAIATSKRIFVPAGTYLVKDSISLRSGTVISGEGAISKLIAGSHSQTIFRSSDTTGVTIQGLSLDGLGSRANLLAPLHHVIGIHLSGVVDFKLQDITISNLGVTNQSRIIEDRFTGGHGIVIDCRAANTRDGLIERCHVTHIAGGGNYTGDGIYIGSGSNTNTTSNIEVKDCTVREVGRHCYSVAASEKESLPTNIRIVGCVATNAALCGIDIEDAGDCSIKNLDISECGRPNKYYQASSIYGEQYRLLAGIAAGNNSGNVYVQNVSIRRCGYGITYGAVRVLGLRNINIEESSEADLSLRLASGPRQSHLESINCSTPKEIFLNYAPYEYKMDVENCAFSGRVHVAGNHGRLSLKHCSFPLGISDKVGNTNFIECVGDQIR